MPPSPPLIDEESDRKRSSPSPCRYNPRHWKLGRLAWESLIWSTSSDLNLTPRSVGHPFWVGRGGKTHQVGSASIKLALQRKDTWICGYRTVARWLDRLSTPCCELSSLYLTISDRWRSLLAFRSPGSRFHNPPLAPHCDISQLWLAVRSASLCGPDLSHRKLSPTICLPSLKMWNWWPHISSTAQLKGTCFSQSLAWPLYMNHAAFHPPKAFHISTRLIKYLIFSYAPV